MEVAIIGGGPIGCYAAYLLAKTGHQATVYEKKEVGDPIQCTGILTSEFDEFNIPLDSFLINTIQQHELNSPQQKIIIKQKDYIVCRRKFDNYFANIARKAGAKVLTNHCFLRKEGKSLIIKNKDGEFSLTPNIVIAADGPLSPTAKAYGFYHKDRENFFGVQAVVEGNFTPAINQTYFGKDVCPGLFAWITPESSIRARVGLAMKRNSKSYFDKFIEKNNFKIIEMQAGTIPLYHPRQKLQQDNCYLLGDASGYVKATTLGGLVPALKQVQILINSLNNKTNYQQACKPLVKQLKMHLLIQKVMAKVSDQDWDKIMSYTNQPKVRKIFEKYTRDDIIKLVSHTILKEPRYLLLAKYLL